MRHVNLKTWFWAALLLVVGSHHLAMATVVVEARPALAHAVGSASPPASHRGTVKAEGCAVRCDICPMACPFESGADSPRALLVGPLPPAPRRHGPTEYLAWSVTILGAAHTLPTRSASQRRALAQVFRI